jgi:thioredoxin reductase
MRHLKTKIIDSLEELGGQLAALYPEKFVFDVAGFPKILARDLSNNLIEQAMQYHPTICLGEIVTHLDAITEVPGVAPADPPNPTPLYKITTNKGTHYTRTVMIAAGGGAFSPRKLMLKEAPALENHGVHYFVRSKSTFAGKNVLIVGGGDSAVDWALNLLDVAAEITLIHRRNQFRAHEDSVRRMQKSRVKLLTFFELQKLLSENGELTGVIIENNQTKETKTLKVDAVLAQLGFLSSLGPLKEWPLKLEHHAIAVNTHIQTNLPGIFAAGDVATFDGKLKLIATGFGEAATAVNYAKTLIDPHAKVFPGHSSELTPQAASNVTV